MLRIEVFDAMRSTGGSVLYETGRAAVLSTTDDQMSFESEIQSGRFAGDLEVVTLTGSFKSGQGVIDEWQSRVEGDLHYQLRFDDPVRLQNLQADLESAATDGIRFTGNKFANVFNGDEGRDRIKGGGGDDRLKGLDGSDALLGGAGDDILAGGNGQDLLKGGDGDDGLVGGRGDDDLRGGDGRDLLIGGKGSDLLVGGKGADLFRFSAASDNGPGSRKRDIIKDFESGVDLLDLSEIDARLDKKGNNQFSFVGDDEFSGRSGELRFDRGKLRADIDGDGRSDLEIYFASDVGSLTDSLIL